MKERDAVLGTAISKACKAKEKVGSCPPLEDIAALVDVTVSSEERDALMCHFAECDRCREVFISTREMLVKDTAGIGKKRYLVPSAIAVAVVMVLAVSLTLRQPATEKVHVAKKEAPGTNAGTPVAVEQPLQNKSAIAQREKSEIAPLTTDKGTGLLAKGGGVEHAPMALLTADEAALPAAKSFGFAKNLHNDGPAIAVEDMEIKVGRGVFSMVVNFTSKEGSPVDLTTLKLECLKSSTIDLTSRIRQYVDKDGIKIHSVALPDGMYRFRVSIGDVNGRLSEKEFTVKVSVAY